MFKGDPGNPMDGLREHVAASVLDEDRAQSILSAVDRIDELLAESGNIMDQGQRDERVLFVDYDSTREDFQKLMTSVRDARRAVQEQILGEHLSIKSQATEAEWSEIRPVMVSAVTSRVEALLSEFN
jgi:dsDNA-binding SOS-regulon protein